MPRLSDDILARVAAWPEDQEGFAGNFERDMARELIAARAVVEAVRKTLKLALIHNDLIVAARNYDEATK